MAHPTAFRPGREEAGRGTRARLGVAAALVGYPAGFALTAGLMAAATLAWWLPGRVAGGGPARP